VQKIIKKFLDFLNAVRCLLSNGVKAKFSELPSFAQWKRFFEVLTRKEKILFAFFFFCFLGSSLFLSFNFYFKNTKVVPTKGGEYIEGVVGQPRFINPVLASSDIDRDLVELVFSGLMKYEKDGKIVPDLIQEVEGKEGGKIYEIVLNENIFWHDGQKITADDVIFTIKTIQDPDFKSPEITNWIGIEVEKISDQKLAFKLKNPYFPFLERLTLKILPKHVFEEIPPENFPLTLYNLEPIGSGPFRFKEIKINKLGKVESLTLIKNQNYFGKLPYLEEITFLFFENQKDLLEAAKSQKIQGLTILNPKEVEFLKEKFILYQALLPRYFAIFFNPKKSNILAEKEFRKALNLATNKSEILEKVVGDKGKIVHSPILSSFTKAPKDKPEIYGFKEPSETLQFNLEKAKEALKKAGLEERNGKFVKVERKQLFDFKKDLRSGNRGKEVENLQRCLSFFADIYPEGKITGYFGESTKKAVILFQEKYKKEILEPWGFKEGTGIVSETTRRKLNEVCNEVSEKTSPLKFSLITVDQPLLVETANLLKSQWERLGIEIEILALEFNELNREIIKPREYEMLLFGEALGMIPDPFPFWHSSRIEDPGLNLALYENKKADEFLKKAREAENFEEFKENLEKFQEILIKDVPAIFLYSPDFFYLVSSQIKEVNLEIISDPSKRFLGIEDWYIKTKRIWK